MREEITIDQVIAKVNVHIARFGGKKPADRALGLNLGTCERIIRKRAIPSIETREKLGILSPREKLNREFARKRWV